MTASRHHENCKAKSCIFFIIFFFFFNFFVGGEIVAIGRHRVSFARISFCFEIERIQREIKQCTGGEFALVLYLSVFVCVYGCVSQRDQGLGSSLRNERLAETIFIPTPISFLSSLSLLFSSLSFLLLFFFFKAR